LPILVGGSNLYIDALIYNYDLSAQPRDDKYENVETKKLYSMLVKKDASIAKTIDQNNKRRIIRALQILESGGAFRKKDSPIYDAIFIYSYMEKPELDKKINANVEKMYKNG
jgi:tRNA dimethylallyltransferase